MGKFLAGLVVLIALIVGGLVWILSDPNRFKPEILALIAEQTGLKVRIDGELAWRLWPPVQLVATDVAADWVDPDQSPLLKAQELRLDADLLPLLSGDPKLVIDGVTIGGLNANLVQTGERANWTPPGMTGTPPPVPVPPPNPDAAATGWEIGALRLSDAEINYTKDGETSRISLDRFEMTGIAPDRDIPIRAAARIASAGTLMQLELDGGLRTDPGLGRWTLADLRLGGTLAGAIEELPFNATINGEIDTVKGTASFRDSTLTLADAPLNWSADVKNLDTDPVATGHVALVRQPIPRLLKILDVDHPAPMGAEFDFDATAARVRLTNLTADAFDSKATGTLTYNFSTPPKVDFALRVDSVVIESTPNPAVAFGAPATLGLVAAAGGVDLAVEPLLPLETLRGLDWQGTLDIAELVYDGARFPNTHVETVNRGGRVDATVDVPSFFGGTAASKISIDARPDTPVWRVTPALSKVDSEALMTWLDQKLYWAALLLADGEFELRGNTEADLVRSITGKSRFDGGQGTMDISQLKRAVQTVAQLAGSSDKVNAWPERLDYKRLVGNWAVDGQQHVIDLALDNIALAMNGTYDPFNDTMDMKIDVTVRNDPEIKTFQVNSMLMDLAIPVRCTGPTTGPTCRPDEQGVKNLIARALSGQAGEKTTQRIDKAIEENVPEEHREAARSLLKGFGELLKQSQPPSGQPQPQQ